MINKERLLNEFIELVKIDSLSFKERKIADRLKVKIRDMGFEPYEDKAGEFTSGEAGNLIFTVKGNKNAPTVLLMSHMDTVAPGIGKEPIIDGDIIHTNGETILGGDDLAGVACILEAVKVLRENQISHGDIQVVFTIAEECGLVGAKNLDYEKISAKYGFVLDEGGKIGSVAVKAPSQNKIEVIVKGKAAHAGVEPEKGISAIQIASYAISKMKLGRIDDETTANIGIISGGTATNIICDTVKIEAESRSRNPEKLEEQTLHMKKCFEDAAALFGGSIEFTSNLMYPAYEINKTKSELPGILEKASEKAGVDLQLISTGGGSDTNILNGKGIESVNISVGMSKVHSVDEEIRISDIEKAAGFLVEIIRAVAEEDRG